MWCCGCSCCAACGVAVTAFALYGCHSHSCCAVWCCGYGGYCCATWCHSCSYCHHIVTGPQKRKLVEKRKKKTYQQANMVCAAARGTVTRCMRVQGHGEVGACQRHR